jgi:hypothetical protein
MLPRCLRAAECKFEYDEESLRLVLGTDDSLKEQDIDEIIEKWHQIRLEQLQSSWKGNKKCLAVDCPGFLQASLKMVQQAATGDGSVGVKCSHCHVEFCWGCQVNK